MISTSFSFSSSSSSKALFLAPSLLPILKTGSSPRYSDNPKLPRTPTVRRIASSSPPPPPPPRSAYVHLPFCRRRCHYCDFPIVALGSASTGDDDERISSYISLVLREISAVSAATSASGPLETIFLGGGTPSLVPPRLVATVLDALRAGFGLAAGAEVSIEMDPGTFDGDRLGRFLAAGVNRVSLGVQAFQEELLVACGRAHGVREVEEAVAVVSAAVPNWSIDLISSLPHQTAAAWRWSLELAAAAGPTHVSVYDLQIEKGTKFGKLYMPGEFPLPSDELSAEMYRTAAEILTREGYLHYEISSYAKPGFECRHNLGYWANRPFYGFGLGAASYTDNIRFTRPRRIKEYAEYVAAVESGTAMPAPAVEAGSMEAAMEVVMLSLRTARGLDMERLAVEFGDEIVATVLGAMEEYVVSGHVAVMDAAMKLIPVDQLRRRSAAGDVRYLRLSDPEGFLLSNELISSVFAAISP